MELRFAVLYLRFLSMEYDPAGKDKIKEYERAVGPLGRFDLVYLASEKYFMQYCDQALEGAFERIITEARFYILRRNDIAHGTVREITFTVTEGSIDTISAATPGLVACRFLLVPLGALEKRVGQDNTKLFSAYNSTEISVYWQRFLELRMRLDAFLTRIPTRG